MAFIPDKQDRLPTSKFGWGAAMPAAAAWTTAPRPQAEAAFTARMRLLSGEELPFSKRRGVVERRRHAFVAMEDRQASRRES
jgi:hypothetical protein